MRKADAAVELRIAAHAFFYAGHADQDQPDLGAVELVAQVFQGAVCQALGFIDNDQLSVTLAWPCRLGGSRVEGLVDAGFDTVSELVQVLAQRSEGACDRRRVEDGARSRQGSVDLFIGWIARPPAFQKWLRDVPLGIAPGRQCFANPGGAIAQPDSAILAHGAGELHEALMGACFDEGGVCHVRRSSL